MIQNTTAARLINLLLAKIAHPKKRTAPRSEVLSAREFKRLCSHLRGLFDADEARHTVPGEFADQYARIGYETRGSRQRRRAA
jgi:hypothetical protein